MRMNEIFGFFGVFLLVVVLTALCAVLILAPVNYLTDLGNIAAHKATQETLCQARMCKEKGQLTVLSHKNKYELATVQHKVIETNRWLARAQYWNSIPFIKYAVPDGVDDLKPVH